LRYCPLHSNDPPYRQTGSALALPTTPRKPRL